MPEKPREAWKQALKKVRSGESDGIVMHVDTLRLLEDEDWNDLKKLGLDVGAFTLYKKSKQ